MSLRYKTLTLIFMPFGTVPRFPDARLNPL